MTSRSFDPPATRRAPTPLLGWAAGALVALAATPVLADGEGVKLAEKVDFSKPPSKVENYNKYRFTVTPREGLSARPDVQNSNFFKRLKEKQELLTKRKQDGEDIGDQLDRVKKQMEEVLSGRAQDGVQGLTLVVEGQAYYPDGAVLMLGVRYWKLKDYFFVSRSVVKDRVFTAELGPFSRQIPRGKLVVEAFFALEKQPPAVQETMARESYFSCTPPCRYDKVNVTRVFHDMGGEAAQKRAEELEKQQVEEVLTSITDARQVARLTFGKARAKQVKPEAAAAALARLEEDARITLDVFNAWVKDREFLLYPAQSGELRGLVGLVVEEGQLQAAMGGVSVPGLPPTDTGRGISEVLRQLGKVSEAVKGRSESLQGFVAEEGSLDKMWERLGEQAEADAKMREALIKQQEAERAGR